MGYRRSTLGCFLLISVLLSLSITVFLAADIEDLFELGDGLGTPGSGDILGSVAQEGCDWADLFDADPTEDEIATAVEACEGIDAAFIADQLSQGSATDDTTFAKGSSKNNAPVATWEWTTGNSPSKDDLSNVYAYATLNEYNELVIYTGVERLAPSGDSHIDFEFNQNPVDLDKDPPCGQDGSEGPGDGAPCEFTGTRTAGDLLVVMDFKKGGDLGFLEVRQWDGADYLLVETVGNEGCNATETICAFNNGYEIDGGPWDNFDSHGRVVDTLGPNAFTEAGVNVTALFGDTPCYVTVQAKSRASTSFSSSLKDFARTSFDICTFEIDKRGAPPIPDLSKIGDYFTYRYTITNTGAATLYLVSVIDSHLGDITDEALAAKSSDSRGSCSPLYPGTSCTFDVTAAIPDDADDPFESWVDATYDNSAARDKAVIVVTDSDEFSLNLFQPSVSVTKTGDTLSMVGNEVLYTIAIANEGSDDSPPLVNASVTDSLLGDLLDPANLYEPFSTCTDTLPTGATCVIEVARTVQDGDPDPLPNTVEVSYNPEGFPNIIDDSDDHTVNLVAPDYDMTIEGSPAAAYRGDLITYTYVLVNNGDVPLHRISVDDSLMGDISEFFPEILEPGEASYQVVLTRVILETDPDPLVSQVVAVYQVEGLPNQLIRQASFSVDILIPCALSPGYWKGGEGVPKWDDLLTDPIAQAAGFDTHTVFPWLDPTLAGTTYLGVLELPALGEVTRQLGFKYVAARLNQAAFGVPGDTALLLDRIDLYFALHPVGNDPQGEAMTEGQGLLNALNDYFTEVGEKNCPDSF